MFQYTFFQYALWGTLPACLLCAMVGTYMVTRRTVIAGGGMAHASLGGVGLGAYFGFPPLLGAALFAVLSGLGINALQRQRVREDSAVAMLWTFGMSVGILFAYLTPGFMTDLPAYLFGDVLAVTPTDILITGILAAVCGVLYALCLPVLVLVAYDAEFARTRRIPVRAVETVMTVFTALTIVACLHTVGIVLVISLLTVPQVTAALFVRTFGRMVVLSAVLAYAACVAGLCLSFIFGIPSGATIILVSILLYLVCRTIKTLRSRFIKV